MFVSRVSQLVVQYCFYYFFDIHHSTELASKALLGHGPHSLSLTHSSVSIHG